MREKLDRSDIRFLLTCAAIAAVCILVVLRYFDSAFPEASIDFRVDRQQSQQVAEKLLDRLGVEHRSQKNSSEFDHDDNAKIYLERTVGLQKANVLMRHDVKVWYWRHRWFQPLQTEEVTVDIAPTGEVVAFQHKIPEERPLPSAAWGSLQPVAENFLRSAGVAPAGLNLVSRSERKLPGRIETILTWESKSIHPVNTPYRYVVTLEGATIAGFSQSLKVSEQWIRAYGELRSKNTAAGAVDSIFLLLTILAGLVVFIARLRRGDVQLRFVAGVGIVAAILVTLVSLNAYPSALAHYDTQTSFSSFVTKEIVFSILQGVAVGLFLMVVVGSGEALYRERFPNQLAIPRLFRREALASRRLFRAFILGYTLVALFMAYQVVFYLVASHFGAWSPAEVPYDEILNTKLPWVAVLFMGFFPAMSEEFMSRAFSIPFLEKLLHSRVAAVVLAGFIWGFGHAAYPNQPFYIRGVEVGIAGVIIGTLLYRFGLLPLLIWHYTVDALYTSLLLLRSHNAYYVISGGGAALLFALPIVISVIGYFRRGGFEPDATLDNSVIGTVAAPEAPPAVAEDLAPVAAGVPLSRGRIALAAAAVMAAILLALVTPATIDDVIDYRTGRAQAVAIARAELAKSRIAPLQKNVSIPDGGFRSWDSSASREEGGSPGDFDDVTLRYLFATAPHPVATAIDTMRNRVQGATWIVRFFTPQQKEEAVVEVDPRTARPVGLHHYQPEEKPGARLEMAAAEPIALAAFGRFGLDPSLFERKEALSFQQPNRRDWLFHFQEKQPIAGSAYRRVSVRVEGNEVTQLARTVWLPEKIRRDNSRQTFFNTALLLIRIAGFLGIIGMAVAGFVISLRRAGFPWRRAARWTATLIPLAIAAVVLQFPLLIANYDTKFAWSTFMVILGVGVTVQIGLQLAAVFVALAVIEAIHPGALRLVSREGRAAAGRAAVIVAVTAAALYIAWGEIINSLQSWIPRGVYVAGISIPDLVGAGGPAVIALWRALFAAVVGSAIIAAIAEFVRSAPPRRRTLTHAGIVLALACSFITPDAVGTIALTMALQALATGIFIYLLVRFVAGETLLAYPLTIFAIRILRRAAELLGNHRPDLQINGVVLLVVLGAVLLWMMSARGARALSAEVQAT